MGWRLRTTVSMTCKKHNGTERNFMRGRLPEATMRLGSRWILSGKFWWLRVHSRKLYVNVMLPFCLFVICSRTRKKCWLGLQFEFLGRDMQNFASASSSKSWTGVICKKKKKKSGGAVIRHFLVSVQLYVKPEIPLSLRISETSSSCLQKPDPDLEKIIRIWSETSFWSSTV